MGYFKRFFRRFLNRLSYLHFNGKAFTIFIIYFIVFILLSFNIKSEAHSTYYDAIQTFTGGKPWVLYVVPSRPDELFIAVSPDTRYARTINNYGTSNGVSYGLVGFTENYDTDYWVKNNVYKLNFTNGEFNGTFNGPNYDYAWNTILGRYSEIIDINYSTYDYNNNIVYNVNDFNYQYPFIENNSTDIENWSFDNLQINGGDVSPYWQNITTTPIYYQDYKFYLDITTNGITYSNYIQTFVNFDEQNDRFFINIPRQALSSYFNINDGQSVNFYLRLKAILPNGDIYENDGFDLGTYTLSLTAQQVTDINNESDKYTQGSIEENQKETNQKLDDLNSSINNSDISDITNDTLPSDSTQDITADGVNGIFTSIYNAFCTGTPQDIVFPIPFTNKNITLSPNYVSDMLTSSGATFVITIIQAFWWYLISRFIVKDVMNKINKIKSGNIENIEETNIRGDML